ncbi:MAG: CoB--CoM heterodisulfide reductase iron-sulfur subunit B family protein [Candidatus Aminicenantes bacterium]|nr:CoB--CoM heterodisulfide reductase iron-sulfur subunit B family protein [Candidatus Aminicenantes bacterium]
MKIAYYPGCTLKAHGKNFEESALCSLKELGIEVFEIPRWNCCGTVFSLAADDVIHHIAPLRNLIRAQEAGFNSVVTLCAMCYNTLKRSKSRFDENLDIREKIQRFMDEEKIQLNGSFKILHYLEFLRDEIKFENLTRQVVKPLKGLKVANYYGCLLVRPKEIGFDDMENPTIMDNLIDGLGAKAIDFPYKTECCGAYQTVDKPQVVILRTAQILKAAQERGADVVAVSCPLCAFNLDYRQKDVRQAEGDFKLIPVLYFTQLMAIALGCPETSLRFDLHEVDPRPILKEKGLI